MMIFEKSLLLMWRSLKLTVFEVAETNFQFVKKTTAYSFSLMFKYFQKFSQIARVLSSASS
jgi:hypothetical protein